MGRQRNGRGRARDHDAAEGDLMASAMAEAAARPPIWVEGRQAPPFSPRAYAEAGMLMARTDADAALRWLASDCSALAARLEARAEEGLSSRPGRLLPRAGDVARLCKGVALRAEAAGRLLQGGDPSLPEPPPPLPSVVVAPPVMPEPVAPEPAAPVPTPVAAAPVTPAPRPMTALPADPDLAAIRALLAAEPPAEAPAEAARPAPQPARARIRPAPPPPPVTAADRLPQLEKAEPAPETARRLARKALLRGLADWLEIRVLAGAVLAFATPVGYGRALYRHFEGVDLRDYVADCHQPRRNSRV